MSKRPTQPPFGALLVTAVLVASLAMLFLGAMGLFHAQKSDIEAAEVHTRNLAQAAARDIEATFQQVDQALLAITAALEQSIADGASDLERFERFLRRLETLFPQPVTLHVTDAKGQARLRAAATAPAMVLAAQPCFTTLRDEPSAGLVISMPTQVSNSPLWVIPCARRYRTPDGRFAGAVVLPLQVSAFQRQLSAYEVGKGGTLALRSLSGGFVARFPEQRGVPDFEIGHSNISPEVAAFLASGAPLRTMQVHAPFDRARRTLTVRRIVGAPYFILAGLAEADYLAAWRRQALSTVLLMALFLLLTWALALLLWRIWRRHQHDTVSLRESERRYALAERAVADGLWDWNLETGAHYVSPQWNTILGLPADARPGPAGPLFEHVHPDELPAVEEALAAHFSGRERFALECRMRHADGSWRPILCRGEALRDASGKAVRIAGAITDLTERKRAEEENRALEQRVAQAQKLDSLGSLAGGLAHDINNVLAAILSLATLQKLRAPAGSPLERSFAGIITACKRGGSLTRSLLDFARPTLTKHEPVDLNALVREQLAIIDRTTLQRVRVETTLTEGLPPVLGDAATLGHALLNLCLNGVEAMAEGGRLSIATRREGDQLFLEVRDSGRGMTSEVLSRALEPFYSTKSAGHGTGLGLSIVYGTVKAHGGRLELLSEPGQGTTARMCLPSSAQAASAAPPRSAEPPPLMPPMKLLFVDDDELIHQGLVPLLSDLGHELFQAKDGPGALALLEGGLDVAAALLDLNMPGMHGREVLKRIRVLRPQLPVLLITGRADEAAHELVSSHPGVTLLAKPFTLEELRAALVALSKKRG